MKRLLLTIAVFATCATSLRAADWPMWRYDAARSATSPDEMATNLTLLWSRRLPPVRQAWPLEYEQRINFDASYEPVVMGKLLFLGSPNNGSVTAYDTETGQERWTFYTEGPVRCAPACWQGRLYVGSDDGYLYCLDAQRGTLLWKFRGAPADRPDRRQLGNGHVVSFWPVRGGPVIVNGVVYFGAGIWPIFGVFLYALDAETGKVVWSNGDLNYIAKVRIDHNDVADTGLSPQGYLAVGGNRLVIPNGRSLPAGLDLATGKLVHYVHGHRSGSSRLAIAGDYAFVGKEAMVNLYDFREAGSRWAYRGTNAPAGYKLDEAVESTPFSASRFGFSYKMMEGCDAASAFADGLVYGAANGVFYAYNAAKATLDEFEQAWAGQKLKLLRWQPPQVWQFKSPYPNQASGVVIKAGRRIYGYAGTHLLALENLAAPRVAWDQNIDGSPTSLIAADGKLFVATAEGGLYGFGEGKSGTPERPLAGLPPASNQTAAAHDLLRSQMCHEIVRTSGVTSGYCLVLGLTDGRLIDELLAQTGLLVIGVDSDEKKVDALRRRFADAGAYGSRVELFVGRPFEFLFPPYIASLIVSEDPLAAGFSTATDAGKLLNVLHPYGGTLCLNLPPEARLQFEGWVRADRGAPGRLPTDVPPPPGTPIRLAPPAAAGTSAGPTPQPAAQSAGGQMRPGLTNSGASASAALAGAKVKQVGGWSLLVREGALPGSAPWTHEWGGDAGRTFCSQDDVVQAPLGILWYGDGNGFTQFHDYGSGLKPQVAGGQVFATQRQSKQIVLFSYDAYTGRPLWKQEVPSFLSHARLVSFPDAVYLAADGKCFVHDPRTGQLMHTFTFMPIAALSNTFGTVTVKDLRVDGDTILILCGAIKEQDIRKDEVAYWNVGFYMGTTLISLDRKTGRELWRREAKTSFCGGALAVGGGRVFAVDAAPFPPQNDRPATWQPGTESESPVLALDARTGAEVWTRTVHYKRPDAGWSGCDWLAYTAQRGMVLCGKNRIAHALDGKTGNVLWENKTFPHTTAIITDTMFLDWDGGKYDLATGNRLPGVVNTFRGGCNVPVGSKHLVALRTTCAAYTDLATNKRYDLRNLRSGCSNTLIPADGLLNSPNYSYGCTCNYAIQTSFAMVTMPEVEAWMGTTPLVMTVPPARPAEPAAK